jgi:hypothetical protein
VNSAGLRKRLDRLEKILKARIEAAVVAHPPAMSEEDEERAMLFLLRFRRSSPSFTAQDEAEFQRLRALYPYEENTKSPEENIKCVQEKMREMDELIRKGEW